MNGYVLLSILFGVLVMLTVMTYYLRTVNKNQEKENEASDEPMPVNYHRTVTAQTFIYTAMLIVVVCMIASLYLIVKGTVYEGHLVEWLNIVIRLMHVTFGIAWIGASFYFVFLENALNRTHNVREELAGNLWAVHGGGFYYLEKYKIAPKVIPKHLHWFKYEAYFTWLSGFCLLFVVYYFNAKAMLIDKNVLDISTFAGISISIGSFVAAWLMYDLLCKSPLKKSKIWFGIVGVIISIFFAWFYCNVFSARAAYIHFGAMLGSIMVANVFFVIIPAQKAMVNAAKMGSELNPQLGKNALFRSLHNNYFTLPVLFVMISNHFPSTFGFEYPWVILAIFSIGAAGVKHYLNVKEKGQLSVWVLPVSILILLSAAYISAPQKPGECKTEVSFVEVSNIIKTRCISCHSASPTDEFYKVAPNGILYDTPEQIVHLKEKIMQRVVVTKTMPQNNQTNMTESERDLIRCWIEQGASLK